MNRRTFAILIIAIVSVAVFAYLRSRESSEPIAETGPPAEVKRALAFYDTRPYFEQPLAYTEVPEGLGSMDAETCGACHQEIYKEWAVSTHRRAWLDDEQFQQELAKSRGAHDAKKGDVGWMCVNCHTPLVNQLPRLVVELEDGKINKPVYVENPTFDAKLQLDAITCAGCHVRDGIVYGPYGDTDAPHPTAKDPKLLTEETCTRCHQAEQLYQDQNLGCFFSTGNEWSASTHSQEGRTCQSCHMPEVERKIAENFDVPVRKTRRHWFGGSLIPKKPEFEAELAPLRPIYGDGVEIEVAIAPDALELDPAELAKDDRQLYDTRRLDACTDGESCRVLGIVVENVAGHRMPSGDPERHIDVQLEVADAAGQVVARRWYRLNSRYVWWPKIEKASDTRLEPNEVRSLTVRIPAQGEYTVNVTAEKWRMYEDAFDYHKLEGKYVRGRVFLDETWKLTKEGDVVAPAPAAVAPTE